MINIEEKNTVKQKGIETVKQKKNYNFNEKSRYIGFRCPHELFNNTLKGKSLTKTLIGLLEGNVKQSDLIVKQDEIESVKQSKLQILKECVIEFNKLMSEIKPIIPPNINKNKIKEGIMVCREI